MFMSLTHLGPAALSRRAGLPILALLVVCCLTVSGQAQTSTLAARSQPIKIAVIGDSVAHDLGRGMEGLFADNRRVRIIRRTKFSTGLVRTDYYNWNAVARGFLKKHSPDIIVIVLGGNDRQAIRIKGRRYNALSKGWIADYERRVSRFMNNFKHSRAKIYWVSLPPVRSKNLTRAYRTFNRIYRREAKRHGIHFVNLWDKFLTPAGAYSSFGESLQGVRRQIRKNDGEHFTDIGRRLFASYVARAIGLR